MTTKYKPYMQKLGFVGVLLEVLPNDYTFFCRSHLLIILFSAGHTCCWTPLMMRRGSVKVRW